jgi:hypothetical protein
MISSLRHSLPNGQIAFQKGKSIEIDPSRDGTPMTDPKD